MLRIERRLRGWGLTVDPSLGGRVYNLNVEAGCDNRDCPHVSHDPRAPWREWVPDHPAEYLGRDIWPGSIDEYYRIAERIVCLHHPDHEHARAMPVAWQLPEWLPREWEDEDA